MLSQFYPPIVGGEETMVSGLSRTLAARGHDVAVVTLAVPDAPAFEIDEGVRVHRIESTSGRLHWLYAESRRRHVPPAPDPEAALAIRRIVRAERPDVVHGHNWLVRSFLPVRRATRAPLVVTLHDHGLVCATRRLTRDGSVCAGPAPARCIRCVRGHYGVVKGLPTLAANVVSSRLERATADMYLPISHDVAIRNGLDRGRVPFRVVPNFVPDALAGPPSPDDGPIVFAGDCVPEKGVDVLVEAHERLRDAPPLVLVGRGSEEIAAAAGANVSARGVKSHAETLDIFRSASMTSAPSVWPEPFGLVALEAVAIGRAVVATRIGGLTDVVVDGENGLLVEPGDATGLAAALQRLVDDPALRRRLGDAGRERSAAFRASAIAPLVEEAYAAVLAGGAAS